MTTVTEKIEFNRWYVAIGAGLLVLALLLQPDWLGRLRPDGSLNAVNTLALTFFRIFLVLLGLIVPFWPSLAERRLRGRSGRAASPDYHPPALCAAQQCVPG